MSICWACCRSEGEGRFHHAGSRRRGADDRRHADEEHCDRGQKRTDALNTHTFVCVCVHTHTNMCISLFSFTHILSDIFLFLKTTCSKLPSSNYMLGNLLDTYFV